MAQAADQDVTGHREFRPVSVRALAIYFQNQLREEAAKNEELDNGQLSVTSPDSSDGDLEEKPSDGEAMDCKDIESETEKVTPHHEPATSLKISDDDQIYEEINSNAHCVEGCASGTSSEFRPVPRPRLSILKKQWLSELNIETNGQLSRILAQMNRSDIQNGNFDSPLNEPLSNDQVNIANESIYEEIPSRPNKSPRRTSFASSRDRSKSVDKLRYSLGKIFSPRLPENQIRKTLSALAKSCDTLLNNERPSKPVREPPKPPSIEQLRPAARIPDSNRPDVRCAIPIPCCEEEDDYDDAQEEEDIYETIDGSESENDYEDLDSSTSSEEDPYHDALDVDEVIYESLACSTCSDGDTNGPASDDVGTPCSSSNIYQNDAVQIMSALDRKLMRQQRLLDKKRAAVAHKLKKRFSVTGKEIPVNSGVVKEDANKSRYDLKVHRGETVLILRLENNPPGKWLAKNERGKIGYVELGNIAFDPETVKTLMNLNPLAIIPD